MCCALCEHRTQARLLLFFSMKRSKRCCKTKWNPYTLCFVTFNRLILNSGKTKTIISINLARFSTPTFFRDEISLPAFAILNVKGKRAHLVARHIYAYALLLYCSFWSRMNESWVLSATEDGGREEVVGIRVVRTFNLVDAVCVANFRFYEIKKRRAHARWMHLKLEPKPYNTNGLNVECYPVCAVLMQTFRAEFSPLVVSTCELFVFVISSHLGQPNGKSFKTLTILFTWRCLPGNNDIMVYLCDARFAPCTSSSVSAIMVGPYCDGAATTWWRIR